MKRFIKISDARLTEINEVKKYNDGHEVITPKTFKTETAKNKFALDLLYERNGYKRIKNEANPQGVSV